MTEPSTPQKNIKIGTWVSWKWGAHTAYGQVTKHYTEPVVLTIKGKQVKRNASPEKPAYLLVQENGQEVLKSASELHPAGA